MPIASLVATAAVAFRGFRSDRSLLAAVALVIACFGVGLALGDASLGHEGRLEMDIGWAVAEVLGWCLALAHGGGLAGYPGVLGSAILAKPVGAGTLLGGRFVGLAAGLFLYAATTTTLLLVWSSVLSGGAWVAVLGAGWLLWLRLVVVLAVSTVLLALARPPVATPLAAVACVAGWLVGRFPVGPGPLPLRPLSAVAAFVLPDLSVLDPWVPGLPERLADAALVLARPTLYGLFYAAAMGVGASAIFRWRARRPAARGS